MISFHDHFQAFKKFVFSLQEKLTQFKVVGFQLVFNLKMLKKCPVDDMDD